MNESVQRRQHRRTTHEPRVCSECLEPFTPTRSDQLVCSAKCRRRKHDRYEITDADRAAIRRAAELHPVPLPPLTPEQVRAHIAATAIREDG